MSAKRLLYAIGDIRNGFIREATPEPAAPRRRRWPWAAALAACLCLVLLTARTRPASPADRDPAAPGDGPAADGGLSSPADPGDNGNPPDAGCDGAPGLTVDGVTYLISSWSERSLECPEGFTRAGEAAVTYQDGPLPYYTNPERPEWVYVYQECYDQRKQEHYMAYVRYVEEVLRGLKLVRYRGEVYVSLADAQYLSYQTEVHPEDQARYNAVPYGAVLREPLQGFEPVGRTVLDGHDLAPFSELGSNYLPGQQVLASPAEPDLLLLRYYWSGLEDPVYWVFVRYSHRS